MLYDEPDCIKYLEIRMSKYRLGVMLYGHIKECRLQMHMCHRIMREEGWQWRVLIELVTTQQEMSLDHGPICHGLAVKLLQSLALLASTNSSFVKYVFNIPQMTYIHIFFMQMFMGSSYTTTICQHLLIVWADQATSLCLEVGAR